MTYTGEMWSRMLAALAAVATGTLLVAGCSPGAGNGGAESTRPPAGPPAPTATDERSVDRVLAGLDGVMGDLQRILVRERAITPEVTDRLQSIYTGPELLNQIDAFKLDVDRGLAGYRSTPGNRLTVVSRLISAGPHCVLAEVKRDYSPVSAGRAPPAATLYVILVTKNAVDDPKGYNPTGWAMLYDGVQTDGSQPEDVCA